MGWDQSAGAESKTDFLLRILGLDAGEILNEIIRNEMESQGLEIESEEVFEHDVGYYTDIELERIKFKNGKVFEHRLTQADSGDDWGCDHYSFVEIGKEYRLIRTSHEWIEIGDVEHTRVEERVACADRNDLQ